MIRLILALIVVVLLSSTGMAQQCNCVYRDKLTSNPDPCICKLCECGPMNWSFTNSTDFDAEAALALAKAKTKLTATSILVTHKPAAVMKAPSGHTHTCANGHTWDHTVTAGHDCPVCGLPQYIQDSTPRMVNVGVNNARPIQTFTLGASSGGCANGQCGIPQRTGLFGRPR